jgi:formamidopyrimidine-DNA glycosylase
VYLEALTSRTAGRVLETIRIAGPSLLRTVEPPVAAAEGARVLGLRRLGKRVVFELEDDLFLVIHLMIAGRFHWRPPGATPPRKTGLAAFDFASGSLLLTEAGSKRRASLHVLRGEAALSACDPGGLEVLEADEVAFSERLRSESRTLKRAPTPIRTRSSTRRACRR